MSSTTTIAPVEDNVRGQMHHESEKHHDDRIHPKAHDAPANHHDNALERKVSEIDNEDATSGYRVEAEDNTVDTGSPENGDGEKSVVNWAENDPENPYNFSTGKKIYIVAILVITVLNSTFGSSLPANAIPYIMEEFGITSQLQAVLPISIYLVGYVGGPLLFGPLSEQYGRQKLVIATFILFILFTLACALTPSWNALIGFRFLAGVAASAPIAIVGGTYADIYDDPTTRGLAMAIFMAATSMGPLFSPILSGYITPALGWRWTFWIGLIIAGACLPPMFLIPETYAPILLTRRAAKLRKETGNPNIFSAHELEDQDWKHVATVTLTRPVRMILFELIVGATCLYLAIAYAIFYMTFSSYPLIFQKLYGQGPGFAGFMFLPIGLGELLALPIFIWYDGYLLRAKSRPDPPAWTKKEEYRRLPLACLGGPLYVVSIFWLGWSARTDVHWVVPMLSGLIFGLAYELIFMAMLNYLTDAYEIFAASAMAAASCARSIFGAVLPLATTPMFQRLGIAWACSLLAFLSLAMCVVPFGFLHYGVYIRSRSKFCIYLKERKEKEEEERQRSRNQSRSSLPGLGVGAGGHEKA